MTIEEKILNEVYYEIGSPIKLEEDKTYWRIIALEAMKRLRMEIECNNKQFIIMPALSKEDIEEIEQQNKHRWYEQLPLIQKDPEKCGLIKPIDIE